MKRALIALSFFAVSGLAHAQWTTKAEDDLFSGGKKASMYAIYNINQALAFDCAKDELSMAYIEKTDKPSRDSVEFDMLVKVDNGNIIKLKGSSGVRNSDYYGITSTDKAEIIDILKQASNAKSKIVFGLSVPDTDYKQSFTFDVINSTAAVKKFIDSCEISIK